MIVYDCKLMEIRRAFFVGWMGCGALFFVVDGGWRMADAGRLGDGCRFAPGFVGGWLLGCRNSAKTVFKKSELAACCRSDSGLFKNNADFRQPRISSPPAEADQTASPARAYVHPHHPLPTKIKICYNTTTQQKSKITKRTITNQSHSKSKERQGKT